MRHSVLICLCWILALGASNALAQPDGEPAGGAPPPSSRPAATRTPASGPTCPGPYDLAGPGEKCRAHGDCRSSLWCIESTCRGVAPPAEEQRRRLSGKGRVHVGGAMSVSPIVIAPDLGESKSGTRLALSPAIGYFLIDGFELGFELLVAGTFGELFEGSNSSVAFGPFVRFVIGGGTVQPFIGVGIGPDFLIPSEGDAVTFFDLSVSAGLLIAASDTVAFSLGVRPSFAFGVGDAKGTIITVPIGWLGIEAFL